MEKVTRRSFVTAVGSAALFPVGPLSALTGTADYSPYLFFEPIEAQFIEAACERLIPADATGAGALAADVPHYLDRHLAGAWGAGARLYRSGCWQPGTPASAHPAPATLFRRALRAINQDLAQRGQLFGLLSGTEQDALLAALQSGTAHAGGVPAERFFASLLSMTVEGFFSTGYGDRRDRIAWSMSGFPGACAAVTIRPIRGSHDAVAD